MWSSMWSKSESKNIHFMRRYTACYMVLYTCNPYDNKHVLEYICCQAEKNAVKAENSHLTIIHIYIGFISMTKWTAQCHLQYSLNCASFMYHAMVIRIYYFHEIKYLATSMYNILSSKSENIVNILLYFRNRWLILKYPAIESVSWYTWTSPSLNIVSTLTSDVENTHSPRHPHC